VSPPAEPGVYLSELTFLGVRCLCGMEKEDAYKQSREVLHERRKQVIRMHRKGVAVMEISVQTGLSWTAVNTALRLYKTEGSTALKPGVQGKKTWQWTSLDD